MNKFKQTDLIYPHPWDERKPAIDNRVLFVPDYYFEHEKFTMPPLSDELLFGNDNPVNIEYCSGNGEWIIEKALANPNINWFGVEMRFKRVRKIWSKMMNLGLKNLIVVCGDANEFIRYYLGEDQISQVNINFPDPWPKEKHEKNRLIQGEFVKHMMRTLKRESDAIIVTDDPDYSHQVIDEMNRVFTPAYEMPHYVEKSDEYGSSYFNRLWVEKGKFIRYMKFQNQK